MQAGPNAPPDASPNPSSGAVRKTGPDAWLCPARRGAAERLDPHRYARGLNGLTVREATGRAFSKVLAILARSGEEYPRGARAALYGTIEACVIAQVRRDNLYRIAGILVADRRDEGVHLECSLLDAYIAAVRKAFLTGVSVGETVFCTDDRRTGKVRYVSADGTLAVVALRDPDTGEVRETFRETRTLSRANRNPDRGPGA